MRPTHTLLPSTRRVIVSLLALVAATGGVAWGADEPRPTPGRPAHVRIVHEGDRYRLLVDDRPFHVRGAGLGSGSQAMLKAAGGNSVRTWRTQEGGHDLARAVLDEALANGLFVTLGIDVARERHGFDYDDRRAVAQQLTRIRAEVRRYRKHPALLAWAVGNELNLEGRNPRVWNAVDELARMIHEEDPLHPVMTTLAGLDPAVVREVKARAPALDLIGVQLYGDIENLRAKLDAAGWDGPYLVTEWGPTGHWEVPKAPWGAPIEDTSTRKAERLLARYQGHIATDTRQCLGSYVFFWGQKQERTATWYGLFLASGEATAGVDAMQFLWSGRWPSNRAPQVSPVRIEGRTVGDGIELGAGQRHRATIDAEDADGDALAYRWQLLEESRATEIGGDHEQLPREIATAMQSEREGTVAFSTPERPGDYRLVVTVRDGNGRAGHANLPIRVVPGTPGR